MSDSEERYSEEDSEEREDNEDEEEEEEDNEEEEEEEDNEEEEEEEGDDDNEDEEEEEDEDNEDEEEEEETPKPKKRAPRAKSTKAKAKKVKNKEDTEEIDYDKARKLFNVKLNQVKMIKRRGYNTEKEDVLSNYRLEDFLDAYVSAAKENKSSLRSVLYSVYERPKKQEQSEKKRKGEQREGKEEEEEGKEGENEKLFVYFADIPSGKQIGVDVVKYVVEESDNHGTRNILLVVPVPLSPPAKKEILKLPSYNIQIFTEDELGYDPTSSFLVPPHTLVTTEEKEKLLKRNTVDQFPIILDIDMMVRYYGFKIGDIIKIERTNLFNTMVQKSLFYRVVRPAPVGFKE